MRVLFIQDNAINESLALTELSGHLKAHGHHTRLFLEKEEKNLERKIRDFSPDLFLVPYSILAHNWALRMAAWLKACFGKTIVFAGTHPTFFPDIIHEEPVDILCVGEAEGAVLELCEKLEKKEDIRQIRNLWVKHDGEVHKNPLRPLLQDLDALPLPDRELYYHYRFMRNFQWKKFMSGRGCYHHCSYCYQPAFRRMYRKKGTYVRRKTPRRVVDEICAIRDRYPIRIAHFSDDLFITDADWTEEFAEEKNRRCKELPFSCNSSVEFVNERTVRALKKAGCRYVAIGIETGDEEERARILNKKIRNEEIRHAARLIKDAGIRLVTFNMLAGPGESVRQALTTLRLNREIRADHARVTLCNPIPGTRLVEESVQGGHLDAAFGSDHTHFPDVAVGEPRPRFRTSEEGEFRNLYYLFNWGVLLPGLEPLLKRLIRLPPNPLFKLAGAVRIYMEKRVSGLTLVNGLIYFRHVGDPAKQTTNFVILV